MLDVLGCIASTVGIIGWVLALWYAWDDDFHEDEGTPPEERRLVKRMAVVLGWLFIPAVVGYAVYEHVVGLTDRD